MADTGATGSKRRNTKSAAAFRTISEVAEELDLPQHVLRFWETKFTQVHPLKRGGGRRYYRPEDVDLLKKIRNWLYNDGYTIKGVQKLLRQRGKASSEAEIDEIPPGDAAPDRHDAIEPSSSAMDADGGGAGSPSADQPSAPAVPLSADVRGQLSDVLQELRDIRGILS